MLLTEGKYLEYLGVLRARVLGVCGEFVAMVEGVVIVAVVAIVISWITDYELRRDVTSCYPASSVHA